MLYQYKKFNKYTISSLIQNTIWFSTPDMFNDPFDSFVRFYFHGSMDTWFKFLTTTQPWATNPEPFLSRLSDNIDLFENEFNKDNPIIYNKIRVSCFSKSPKVFLMWSHYADYHKGICIGYNAFYSKDRELAHIQVNDKEIELPVMSDVQYLPVKKVIYKKRIQYEFNQLTQSNDELAQLMFIKGNIWRYEKEWRSLHGIVEKEKIHLAENTINTIYIGSKMPFNDEKLLNEIVDTMNLKRTSKLKIYKAYLSDKTNELAMRRCKY